ncbi:ParA family protein [Ostreibacterium oceani]|uniref:AAA family ATPase n=1 Tax=Ostreibacterium oceani TaxID=2654998 RepID=A0A6N7EV04_9GAMM|nr:ParA family protein [Ostreibacterium oceani]MPV86604.1 AAA family ATPase [Ostreibacterium oceani]
MKIIAICNQKGGVAKTTTAVNLAASLGILGQRVLLVDLDPQGNASIACGIDKKTLSSTLLEVLTGEQPLAEIILPTRFESLALAPSNQDLTAAEVSLAKQANGAFQLRRCIEALTEARTEVLTEARADDTSHQSSYDTVVIDCPPALNILTVNALSAADYLIVPIQCEYYALEGLTALLDNVADIRASVNSTLNVLGFLRTMFDKRARLGTEVSAQLEGYLGDKVFDTIIPRNVRLAEAPSHGMPVYYYERSSKGAKAYLAFAKEVIKRLK